MGLFGNHGGGLFGGGIGGDVGDFFGQGTLEPTVNMLNGQPLDPLSGLATGQGDMGHELWADDGSPYGNADKFARGLFTEDTAKGIGEAFGTIFNPSKVYSQFESIFGTRHSNAQDAAQNPAEAPPSRADTMVNSINTQATALESYRRRYSTMFTSGRGVLSSTPTQNASQTLLGL